MDGPSQRQIMSYAMAVARILMALCGSVIGSLLWPSQDYSLAKSRDEPSLKVQKY